jgi:hypothetical protein
LNGPLIRTEIFRRVHAGRNESRAVCSRRV